MVQYKIEFCYQYPGSEFLNAAGRSLGDNTIWKKIAKGTAYDEAAAVRECERIIGSELKKSYFQLDEKKRVTYGQVGKRGFDSQFVVEIKKTTI